MHELTSASSGNMVLDEEKYRDGLSEIQIASQAGPTLLPGPVASAISLVTRSSALYLRLGTFIGGIALDGARVTTLTGLELSRAIIEGVLSRAGRDVAVRSRGDLGRAEAEGLLERSIATLHSTITTISFAASTGFYISTTALSSAADLSQHLLTMLDSILGSTDSSRAIASIITLIRREFENPATGRPGEKVGVSDLLVGICGLILLQRWCKKLTDQEARERQYDDVVCWDVVILDGRRADVTGASIEVVRPGTAGNSVGLPFIASTGENEILHTIQGVDTDYLESDEWRETNLRERIMQTLPLDASVSITTETTTTKTITVEITGAEPPDLSPPPGVEIIEENAHHPGAVDLNGQVLTQEQKIDLLRPRYRVVYRIIQNKMRGTAVEANSDDHQPRVQIHQKSVEPFGVLGELNGDSLEFGNRQDIPLSTTPGATFSLSSVSSPEPDHESETEHNPEPELDRKLRNHIRTLKDEEQSEMSQKLQPSIPVVSPPTNNANQKQPRKPMSSASSFNGSEIPTAKALTKPPAPKKTKSEGPPKKSTEKRGTLRNALRKGSSVTLSNIWNKDTSYGDLPQQDVKATQQKPPWGGNKPIQSKPQVSNLPVPQRGSGIMPAREAPRAPQRGNPNYFSSRDLGTMNPQGVPPSPSRASYYSVHERRRDSIVSQTDTYSIHSTDTRPVSPTAFRAHLKAQNSMIRARSEKNVSLLPHSPNNHRRSRSYVPSIYTLNTNNSETSLVLAVKPKGSAYGSLEALEQLTSTGYVDGLFPQHHIVRNVTRFIRFASASYGASFMRFMGITTVSGSTTPAIDENHHYEHHSFSRHTQLPPSTILLSSFVDPQGGTDSTGMTNTGVPMVHFISLDHESQAVVLTCRGTLGFEDVLADMTCDYDDIFVRGKTFHVHKGIHASALRLLSGDSSRVLATLAAALEEFPSYGLVLTGHSLGGAVTALLAIMISEPNASNSSFVTTSVGHLPAGRPIHVYAYGPPATLSPSLRLLTRGLITSVVNGQDLVPYLSLGVLHDLQAVALAFKTDDSGAKGEVRARVWAGLTSAFTDKWYGGLPPSHNSEADDAWAFSALKALRASMLSPKLVPPGEVFVVEACPVLQRDAFTEGGMASEAKRDLGRPATRSILKYVRDVEKKFGELRFGGSMLLDHSPGRYETSLAALGRGVLDS